jgi:hypothetical protein
MTFLTRQIRQSGKVVAANRGRSIGSTTILTTGERPEGLDVALQRGVSCSRPFRHDPGDWLLGLLIYRHGLRVSEACDLRWDDIDLPKRTIIVRRLKGSTDSSHYLERDEHKALGDLRRAYAAKGIKSDYVFVNERREPFGRMGIARKIEHAGEAAGLWGCGGSYKSILHRWWSAHSALLTVARWGQLTMPISLARWRRPRRCKQRTIVPAMRQQQLPQFDALCAQLGGRLPFFARCDYQRLIAPHRTALAKAAKAE